MLKNLVSKAEEKAIQAKTFFSARTTNIKSFLKQRSGEGLFADIVLGIVIVAFVGAIVYGVLQVFFPQIITGVMNKVQQGIDGIDMFDGK